MVNTAELDNSRNMIMPVSALTNVTLENDLSSVVDMPNFEHKGEPNYDQMVKMISNKEEAEFKEDIISFVMVLYLKSSSEYMVTKR